MTVLFLKTLFIFFSQRKLMIFWFSAAIKLSADGRTIFLGCLPATLAAALLCAFVAQLLFQLPWKYLRFLGVIPVAVAIHSFFFRCGLQRLSSFRNSLKRPEAYLFQQC